MGHTVMFESKQTITCDTMSVSYIIAQAIEFMSTHSLQRMTVEGTEIKKLP